MRRLDRPVQLRIVEALDRLVDDPPVGDVVRLTGSDDEWHCGLATGVCAARKMTLENPYFIRVSPRHPRPDPGWGPGGPAREHVAVVGRYPDPTQGFGGLNAF